MAATRAEAVALIERQMGGPEDGRTPNGRAKGRCWHYGAQELRDLLDLIYGGPPANDAEKICSGHETRAKM